MVVIGVIGFAIASALCGFTPKGSVAEAWIIFFRVLQGATAALMFPAAVGDRRRLVPAARAREGDGDLLRDLGRA